MATYSNPHWLLSHIRNSFISTDDTGMCETVMTSDDLPQHYLRKFQSATSTTVNHHHQQQQQQQQQQPRKSLGQQHQRNLDPPLQEVDFICYPGLDQSDDEDMDLSSHSFDIQMYPEVGAYRFRSNTAQKLEKMDIARRKAARTKCVNYDDDVVPPERSDFFVRKPVHTYNKNNGTTKPNDKTESTEALSGIRSKLSLQLANSPTQAQNKFMEYARFDGTSQTGIQTKRIKVFISMLPEQERNYPLKICVIATAKIIEVIGLICYKVTIQYPDLPLKSIRHYGLYMTEDNDDLEDFPPLDNREPCSKFGFSHLTLAERRPLASVTRIDYENNAATRSTSSATNAVPCTSSSGEGLMSSSNKDDVDSGNRMGGGTGDERHNEYEDHMLSHNDMLEAPLYRTYCLHFIDKRFFKTEVTLGISGERLEIDQLKNAKFWTKQKAVTYPIDAIAFCEIIERRSLKAVLRIWLRSSSSSPSSTKSSGGPTSGTTAASDGKSGSVSAHSPTSPGHFTSPFGFFSSSGGCGTGSGGGGSGGLSGQQHHQHIRFKHYDFEANLQIAEQICNKLNCILEVRSSEVRREFLHLRARKLEKSQAKKHLKL